MISRKIHLRNCLASITFLFLLTFISSVNSEHILKELQSHANWKIFNRSDECGQSWSDRIIGGKLANLGQYPWIARLGYSFQLNGDSETDLYECGGTIISDRYVLTAAHCSPDSLGIAMSEVRVGEHDEKTNPDCEDGECAPPVQDIKVESYTCHKDYDQKSLHNDICLIRLAKPITFNDYVQPICLPAYDRFQNIDSKEGVMEVAGWGIINITTGAVSDVLLTLKVPVILHNLCTLMYKDQMEIISHQMCAGGVIGEDSCGGDSGGPLMRPYSIDSSPPRYFIIGIVSYGPTKCALSTKPGVYTKVADYMIWILDNVKQ